MTLVIYFLVVLLSICSFLYELIFSHTLSASIGSTFFCYSLTIGTFIFFLGLGSACFDFIPSQKINLLNLGLIEILISLNGLIGVYLITYSSHFYGSLMLYLISLTPTAVCGFFSGLELPFLIGLAPQKMLKLFGLDYIGIFLASMLFPFLFLNYFGVFVSSFIVAVTNLLVAVLLIYLSRTSQ